MKAVWTVFSDLLQCGKGTASRQAVAAGPYFLICYNLHECRPAPRHVAAGPYFLICYNWVLPLQRDNLELRLDRIF